VPEQNERDDSLEMSLEKVDQYLRDLRAIKEYPTVRAERDRLFVENNLKEQEIEELRENIKDLQASKDGLQGDLASTTEELRRSRTQNEELQEELAEMRDTKLIVGGEELTLPRIRELVEEAKSDKIKSRAKQLFDELRGEWEVKQKPKEVEAKAISDLRGIIDMLMRPEPRFFLQDAVNLNLPQDVEKLISSEVDRRLDDEFRSRVEQESDRKASEKLEDLKVVEWPKWHTEFVEPKIAELEALIRENALNQLKGTWSMPCDKCGTSLKIELSAEHIASLLRLGSIEVPCPNPQCLDQFLVFRSRHILRPTLGQLIENRVVSEG